MFKIESYITPILLSYVDKYIKNFRPEDSTVSLWGGDACFHNLDLRLEVLEQELHLPVSFVSGHIRELLIHVPWTKLASEPITITINTIECILKLRGSDASSNSSSSGKDLKHRQTQDLEAPPGYLSSLINKIVGNIRIYCNNLILKYVEEDIVLSMNIKHFKFESANEIWEPAFTDLAVEDVKMRKLICINDLTICLDKRNAAGKIEVYQEPMLYKCSMTMHLMRMYHSATASKNSITRLDIYCSSLEFGMSEQQLPMLIRLTLLLYALKKKKKEDVTDASANSSTPADVKDNAEALDTWGGWAWSYVSAVLAEPSSEASSIQDSEIEGHIFQMGFYVDKASVIFKVTDANKDRNYYSHKKLRYMPVLALELQGIYSETVTHGSKWSNSTFGISEILLSPLGFCSCSTMETPEGFKPIPYIRIGSQSTYYKFNSLFDADALENKGAKKFYNFSWDYHLVTLTDAALLERTPALAVDYIHETAIPDDVTPEKLNEMIMNLEYSNLPERDNTRMFVAPLKLRICSGLYHRFSSMITAATTYEYVPYYIPTPDPAFQDLIPPSEEDFDALNEFIPLATVKLIFFGTCVEFEAADHPKFKPRKGKLYKGHKKMSTSSTHAAAAPAPQDAAGTNNATPEKQNLKIVVEFQRFELNYETPYYLNRLINTTCQLPDPPKSLFDACFKKIEMKILGLTSRLVLNPSCHTIILVPSNALFSTRQILKPHYWTNPDITHYELVVESENFTLNGTKAKILVMNDIISSLFQLDSTECNLYSTSLLNDASYDEGFPYIELYIEGVRFKRVVTCSTISMDMSLDSVRAFIFETCSNEKLSRIKSNQYSDKNIQQILFVSGPETKHNTKSSLQEAPLFTATLQYPIDPEVQIHPTFLTYNIQEIRICVDPLVFKWFLYTPHHYKTNVFSNFSDVSFKAKSTESTFYETSRKSSTHLESVHSSSDKVKSTVSKSSKILKEEPVDMQERIYNFLRDWFDVWKCMIISGEINQCIIYFPMVSLSAVGSQGIQEAVDEAMNNKDPPDILIITLPFLSTYCIQRQKLTKYLSFLPVKLPESVWSVDKSCFPWTLTIKNLSCYTIQNGEKMDCLKPCSLNATIGLSTKNAKTEDSQCISASASKNDISSLGVCVHVDMSPVLISTCEGQVYLFASILYGLIEIASSFIPNERPKPSELHGRMLESIDSRSGSILTIPENSIDQQSHHSSIVSLTETEPDCKLTAWLQWTITRFTIELNSMTKETKKNKPKLKLVIDTEDIVSSIDFQNVYLKIKSKVGSISIEHFKFVKDKWHSGPYLGLVMRHRDDYISEDRHEDNAFINLTITRASCKHTHTLWGTIHKKKDPKSSANVPTRYITEIVVSIKPTDFLLSFKTLRNFYLVLEPLFAIQLPKKKGPRSQNPYITNQVLPLAYLDCHDVRIILPVSLSKKKSQKINHDVFVLQIAKIALTPSAANPICRTPYRPDIYQRAARSRILNIPGSEIEDRQYQLDITGTSLNTGTWTNVELILNQPTGILTSLHGSSENPAVEWNNLEKVSINSINPSMHLWPVLEKIDVSTVAAPAMVYEDVLICCNSVEINVVSDIFVSLCLSQIKLALMLLTEFNELMQPVKSAKSKIHFPYTSRIESQDDAETDIFRDSGIESSVFKSMGSSQKPESIYRIDSEKHSIFSKTPATMDVHPSEILVTGGKISVSLYAIGDKYPEYKDGECSCKSNEERTISRIRFIEPKFMKKFESKHLEDEEMERNQNFIPLFFVSLSQPNIYFLDEKNSRKINFCLFNVATRISNEKYCPITSVPTEKDYPVSILETLSGIPHVDTGIPPAFVTVKLVKSLINNTTLDVDFARPTRLNLSKQICYDLLAIQREITHSLQVEKLRNAPPETSPQLMLIPETNESYTKFHEIKDRVFHVNAINIKTDQLVFVWSTELDHKLRLTIGKSKNCFSLLHRPDKVCNFSNFKCVSLLYEFNNESQLLINPWSITVDTTLFWESWQGLSDDPQIQIIADSDCLVLTLCPDRLENFRSITNDMLEFIYASSNASKTPKISKEFPPRSQLDFEQHYKDDLRAGAFQFVDSSTNNTDEMPLPYQVMFWNKNIAAMAWRYPQPRCLTKVRVFPVPLKLPYEQSENVIEIECNLEYWSDCHAAYLSYAKFILPENEILHLDLPEGKPHPPFACIWRVELKISNFDVFSAFSPRALAACLRIDSYFNKNLIPNFNVALSISRFKVDLYTSYRENKTLPACLKGYNPDMTYPKNHRFSEIILDNFKLFITSWDMNVYLVDLTTSFKLLVLDYTFLTMQPVVESAGFRGEISVATSTCNISFLSKFFSFNFSPAIAHTLSVSSRLWQRPNSDFVLATRYVICNETNVALKFGQFETDEEIVLMPKYFNLYCWRTQRRKRKFRVALEDKQWFWSEAFDLTPGVQIVKINDKKKLTLHVTVNAISTTQFQVVFSGQLIIANMLMEHFELKVIEENQNDNKKIVNQIVAGSSMTTSMVINYEKSYFLRLRFYGLDTSWTGDIPLMEHAKSVQPWLVKVPLLEKGQFLSIWCRVVVQELTVGKKILAMLWPLFSIRSNLPINTNVHIETPTLNYHGEIMVEGKGRLQQLYCPGTIDHSHQLTFQFENIGGSTNPYVPLNYSLIDHEIFFKRMDKIEIQDILEDLRKFNENKWPYFGEETERIDWIVEDQPETHVQVKYQNSCKYSSSLMVELLPWCLFANTSGLTVGIKIEGEDVCMLRHNGIVAPPKIEENFNIIVYVDDESFMSDPLQLAKDNWSSNFYMPKISGIIPTDGTIMFNIKCHKKVCLLSIKSSVEDEIKLLRISSTHVVCNNTGYILYVICVSVPNNDVFPLPDPSECNFIEIPPEIYGKSQGISITHWYKMGADKEQSNVEHVFYMTFSLDPSNGWSKPLRVDEMFIRKPISGMWNNEAVPLVVTCEEHKGQIFLGVHHDTKPQVFIENESGVTLFCAQSKDGDGEETGALDETPHFVWFCEIKNAQNNYYSMNLLEKFPEIPAQNPLETLVFAKDPLGLLQGATWSAPVNINDDTDQYVKIPFHGDVRIVVKNLACLTHVRIESVSKIEISAKDIRARLLEFEEKMKNVKTEAFMISQSKSAEAVIPQRENVELPAKESISHEVIIREEAIKNEEPEEENTPEQKTIVCPTIPMLKNWKSFKFLLFVNEFTFTLLSDIESNSEIEEIATLTCDNVAASTNQTDLLEVDFCILNVQLDNQLYSKKNYDFPVIMLIQEPKTFRKIQSLNVNVEDLLEEIKEKAAWKCSLLMDSWVDSRRRKISGIQKLSIFLSPFSCYVEDTYLSFLADYFKIFIPNRLICTAENSEKLSEKCDFNQIPDIVLWHSITQAQPLTIRHLLIEPVFLSLSVHSSIKLYLALDQTPLFFAEFERRRVFASAYRLGHSLTMHYLSGAIFRAGWMVSSLEILGSPVGLARAMGLGLKDFVSMPFRGLFQGPIEFLYGVTHGSASLMRHVTAGTLHSFTKMASSVARNLDYLTLDEEHVKRAEEQRRQKPSGVTEGIVQGLTGLGISILGAIGGIAHHPLQSVITEGGSPKSLAAGLGLGLVGIITKPLSGAAELLALTGQGLLQGAGWNNMPEQRTQCILHNMFSSNNSMLKYEWKMGSLTESKFLHMTDATSMSPNSQYAAVTLILTNKNLIIINTDDDTIQNSVNLTELEPVKNGADSTLLSFELIPSQSNLIVKIDDDLNVEMDPASRARVADYVKNTGFLQVAGKTREPSEMSISPLSSPGPAGRLEETQNTVLSFYVNPQDRNYFLCLLSIAKCENLNSYNNYPVL